ncbi:MAG: FtsX-like permease family protein [Planctomycetaceae bacterium]
MYKLLLCLRYLRTRYIALSCVLSVTLGVATMIVVNAVMAGFSFEMQDRIKGVLSDVVIEANNLDGTPDADGQMAKIDEVAGKFIAGMTATVEVYGMLSFQYAGQWITRPVTIIGIRPAEKSKVGPFDTYLDRFQSIKEDGVVVRPPLCDAGTPANWSLTAEADEYRRRWIWRQRNLLMNDDHQEERGGIFPPSERTSRVEGPRGSQGPRAFPPETVALTGEVQPAAAETPAGNRNPYLQEASATEDATDDSARDFTGSFPEGTDSAPPDMVAPFAGGTNSAPSDMVDPLEPLRARLYIGEQLVTFIVEDPETGKPRKIRMVRPGDDVKISTITAGRPPNPVHFNATVVDTFNSGMSEYDSSLVFCNLEYLQEARGMIDPGTGTRSITSVQIKLKNYDDAEEVVRRLKAAFPPGLYTVRTWEQKQGPLLAAVEVEKAILNVLLFLIIAVAGFGILAIFFMIVVEKTRDIGILKALGASSHGVMTIFLSYGLGLGVVGAGAGVVLGLLFVTYINQIEDFLTWLTGRKVFDEAIYYFPEIPTSIEPFTVTWIALGAMAIAVLSSILPARRAARLHPVEALRFE